MRCPLRSLAVSLVVIVAAAAQAPQYQVNSPAASLDFGGVQGTALTPSIDQRAQGSTAQLNMSSTLVTPFDVVVTASPLVPAAAGGVVTPGGQIVNVDFTDPALFFLSTGTATPGFFFSFPPGGISLQFIVPNAVVLVSFSCQLAVVDPTNVDFVVLSQGSQLEARVDWGGHPYNLPSLSCPGYALPVPLGNDAAMALQLQAPLTFYGVARTQIYVHSNGFVTFDNPGPTMAIPNAATFNGGNPMIAAFATDLDPSAGGTVLAGTSGPTFDVCFNGVPETGTGGSNTIHLQVNPGGMFIFYGATTAPSPFIGFSAGSNLNPTMALNWSWMGGPNGPLSFFANGQPYSPYQQFAPGDPFDLGGRQLILLFGANGVPNNIP